MGNEIILVGASSLFVLFVFIALFSVIVRSQKKAISFAREKELMQVKFNQALLQTQLEIQEQTMQHIASELHDNMGQVLSLIKINLHTIPVDDAEETKARILDIKELVKQLITDMRSISVSLNTDHILRAGLTEALRTEIHRINKTGQFKASFTQDIAGINIDGQKSLIIFRMVQEVLNNIVKHSEASAINLSFRQEGDNLLLEISDDGKGFDPAEKIRSGSGSGLHNLQKRAALVQAGLNIQSTIGQGTNVVIELPYFRSPNNG